MFTKKEISKKFSRKLYLENYIKFFKIENKVKT